MLSGWHRTSHYRPWSTDAKGEPKGFALLKGDHGYEELSEEQVTLVIHTLRNAGLGWPQNKDKMFSVNKQGKEESSAEYKGFYFKRHFPRD